MVAFGLLAGFFGVREKLWPETRGLRRARRFLAVDTACLIGGGMILLGVAGALTAVASWAGGGFSDMNPDALMRISIPSVLLAATGLQTMLTGFLLELLSRPARS
jgi:hypothetical protein